MTRRNYDYAKLAIEYIGSDGGWHSLKSGATRIVVDRGIGVRSFYTEPMEQTLTVTTTNRAGTIAQLNLYGSKIRVTWDGTTLFTGYVRSVVSKVEPNGPRRDQDVTTTITANDVLADFRMLDLADFPLPQETAGARIRRIEAALGRPRSFINDGPAPLDAVMRAVDTNYTGSAFDLLTEISLAQHGRFYTSVLGQIKLRVNPGTITATFSDTPATGQYQMDGCDPGKDQADGLEAATAHSSATDARTYARAASGVSKPYTRSEDFTVELTDAGVQSWLNGVGLQATPPKLVKNITTHDTRLLTDPNFELTTIAQTYITGGDNSQHVYYGAVSGITWTFDEQFLGEIELANPANFNYPGGYDADGGPPAQPSPDEDTTSAGPGPSTTLAANGGRVLIYTTEPVSGSASGAGPGYTFRGTTTGAPQPVLVWISQTAPPYIGFTNRGTEPIDFSVSNSAGTTHIDTIQPGAGTAYQINLTLPINVLDTGQSGPVDKGAIPMTNGFGTGGKLDITDGNPQYGTAAPVTDVQFAIGPNPGYAGSATNPTELYYYTPSNVPGGIVGQDYGFTVTYSDGSTQGFSMNGLSRGVGLAGVSTTASKTIVSVTNYAGTVLTNIPAYATGSSSAGWVQPVVTVNGSAATFDGSVHSASPTVSLFHKDVTSDDPVTITSTGTIYTLNTAVSGASSYDTYFTDGNATAARLITVLAGDVISLAAIAADPVQPYIEVIGTDGQNYALLDLSTGHTGTGAAGDPSAIVMGGIVYADGSYTVTANATNHVALAILIARQ